MSTGVVGKAAVSKHERIFLRMRRASPTSLRKFALVRTPGVLKVWLEEISTSEDKGELQACGYLAY